ncbi:unnamed protein product [Phytomonas sp. EM1]|nr:unnamed protein product [Phytomonas sp. EM1]|eukprot:CCW64809.1 unnamed protein product [Phytomonas sp. isolate EM1]
MANPTSIMPESELDQKLSNLLQVMVSRLPPGKSISSAVVQQLLRTRYAETYPESYVASKGHLIEGMIASFLKAKKANEMVAATAPASPNCNGDVIKAGNCKRAVDSGSEIEIDDDDYDDSSEDDDDESNDEQYNDSDYDEEEEDDDDDSETECESEDASSQEPKLTRTRLEGEDGSKGEPNHSQAQPAGDSGLLIAERCKGMANCLRKLGYQVRSPREDESLNSYLNDYLISEFQSKNLDPVKYGKNDIKLYKIRKEVELLQKDGATLNLDRRSRVGRGYTGVQLPGEAPAPAPAPAKVSSYVTSNLLDDE